MPAIEDGIDRRKLRWTKAGPAERIDNVMLESGMQPGAAIAFLIAGPLTTVPAMAAVWGVVSPRVFALYVGVGLVGSVLLGLATNLVL